MVLRPCASKRKKTNGFEASGSRTSVKPMILRGQHTRRLYRILPVSESLKKAMKINGSEIDHPRRLITTSRAVESSIAKHMKNIRKTNDSGDHPPTTTGTTGGGKPGGGPTLPHV